MKKILIALALVAAVFAFVSCDSFFEGYEAVPTTAVVSSQPSTTPVTNTVKSQFYIESIKFDGTLVLNTTSGFLKMKGVKDGDRIDVVLGNAGSFNMEVFVQRANINHNNLGLSMSVFESNKVEITYPGGNLATNLGLKVGDPIYFPWLW